MNIYINDPELIKRIKALAKKSNRSVSYIIREILQRIVKEAKEMAK